MAENVQETRPPEPPPKPPEVPKPTEQSNRTEAKDQYQPQQSQQSAQQDARNAAQSEHAQATAREPDGLRPTPEFQERLDQHAAGRNGPEGLRPTPEFQAGLDQHSAAKAERNGAGQQDTPSAQKDAASTERQADPATTAGDRQSTSRSGEQPSSSGEQASSSGEQASSSGERASSSGEQAFPSGEQASEHAVARESAAVEHAKASDPATPSSGADATATQAADQDVQRRPADQRGPTADDDGQSPAAAEPNEAIDRDAQPQTAGDVEQSAGPELKQPASATNTESSPVGTPDVSDPNESGDNPSTPPPDGNPDLERRQYDPQHLDAAGDLRSDPEIPIQDDNGRSEANAPRETSMEVDERTELGAGSGPWFDEGANHREGGAVQQITDGSCVSASGEMLTDGRVTQSELLSEIGDWSNLSALRDELNNRDGDGAWKGQYFATGAEAVERASEGPMAAQVQAPLGRGHMVMLEPGENGTFTVRDPYEGSSYDVDSNWVEKYVAGGVFR